MTATERRALQFINDHRGCIAAELATHLWPDATMHNSTSNQGNGACKGKAAWLCGGSYAGRLIKGGWVERRIDNKCRCRYYLTRAGLERLRNDG